MNSQQLRELSLEEANIRLRDDIAEIESLRFQQTFHELEHPHRIRAVRREIAQLRTLLRELELGIRTPIDKRKSPETASQDEQKT